MLTPEITRRDALATIASTATATWMASTAVAAEPPNHYAGLKTGKLLGKVEIETEIKDRSIFTEGPAVDGNGVVFFTNVPVEKILTWDPHKKKLGVFREKSNKANGLLFAPNGDLLACEGGAGRVTRTNMKTGETKVLASEFNNFPLASPNDLALDAAGHLFFTSRPGTDDPTKGNVNAVYRVNSDGTGKLSQVLHLPEVHMPNGIVTSPDDKTLYLIEAHPNADRNRNIMAYDLAKDGRISNPRVHINFYPGRSGDGMCIDSEGNLYVAAGLHKTRKTSETLDTRPGIHVVSPQGKVIDFIETPIDTITNCAFGGKDLKTLYVTCAKYLLSIRTQIAGKSAYRPAVI